MGRKLYADPATYEAKLSKVMARLGIEQYDYDWSRYECWVSFVYKGQPYRFSHSVKSAQEHGVNIQYGSDAFAQVILSLEDLARMVERGIYDLSTWVSGMRYLPEASSLEPCFQAIGFAQRPTSVEEVKEQYKRMAKAMHPDSGGSDEAFITLKENYKMCLSMMEAMCG